MNRTHLISLTAVAMTMTAAMASSANAQEPVSTVSTSTAATPAKSFSIGPAIEFSGGGTSFGIKGKIGVGPSISVRPSILFGYTPNVNSADFNKAVANGAANSLNGSLVALTPAQKRAIVRQQIGAAAAAALTDAEVAAQITAAEATPADKRSTEQKALLAALAPVEKTTAEKRTAIKAIEGNAFLTDTEADKKLADATAKPVASRTAADLAVIAAAAPTPKTPEQTEEIARNQAAKNAAAKVTDAEADKLLADASKAPTTGRTADQQALVTATADVVRAKTPAEQRDAIRALPGNASLTDAQADQQLAEATAKSEATRTPAEKAVVAAAGGTVSTPQTLAQKRAAVRTTTGNAGLTDAEADKVLADANKAPVLRTPAQQALIDGANAATPTAANTTPAAKLAAQRAFVKDQLVTDADATRALQVAEATPAAERTPAQQALVTGAAGLSGDDEVAFVKNQLVTDAAADQALADANKAPAGRTPRQVALLANTKPAPFFSTLTPAERRAQVRLFGEIGSDQQATKIAADTEAALKKAPADRTPSEKALVDRAGLGNSTGTTAETDAENAFEGLTPAEKKKALTAAYKLTDAEADVIAAGLDGAIATPEADRNDAQLALLARTNLAISFVGKTDSTGFTPGSGVAYGGAVTYDFATGDKKLTGYVGPRVMFASGSSKVGRFDTNTSETSLGLLLGADYEISPDFTAGLSGTYNFSRSGNLDVSAPGGFKGSSSISGSSFDVGLSLGFRF